MSNVLPVVIWVMSITGCILLIFLISNPLIRYVNNEVNTLTSSGFIYQKQSNFKRYKSFKRIIDIIVSFFALLIFLPLLVLIWLVAKITTNGPVISSRFVFGQGGVPFELYNFRVHPLGKSEKALSHIPTKRPPFTRFGRFLYVTSLAYLPSLYNVLKGDLSLIGISAVINYYETKDYLAPAVRQKLLQFKPGLLSLYSVSKDRTIDEFHKMQLFDLYYIQHISFKLDILILISGIIKVLAKPTYQKPLPSVKELKEFSRMNVVNHTENVGQEY